MSAPYEAGGPPSGAPGGKTSLGLDSNVGAMLCYIANFLCCLGLVLAIVFLFTEKENRLVKFHAIQSLLLAGVQIGFGIVLSILGLILGMVLGMIHLGWIAFFLMWGLRLVLFAIFAGIWIMAGIKAYGGQEYKLPLIGDWAASMVSK